MSVQIKIGNGGTFPDTTVIQSDLVFWYNDDTQTHYPVPRCESLEVQPGGTTPAYQPIPQPALPTTAKYICAIHPNESGNLTVDNDPNSAAQTAGTVGPGTKEIVISSGGKFAPIDVVQSDNVVWKNDDSKAHWPVPNCSGLQVKAQGVSNAAQFFPPALPGPLPISYGCAIAGHESEQGTINVYVDFVAGGPLQLSSSAPTGAIATGGKSPYAVVQDPSFPYLTVSETTPVGSSAGLTITLGSGATTGTVNYQLKATDALGNPLDTPVQITIS
jgi:hypothetical protein